jgi:osmoprotectant transport system permease protein
MNSFLGYLSENWNTLLFYGQQTFLVVLYSVAISSAISIVLALVLYTNQLSPPSWSQALRAGSRETVLLTSAAVLTIPSLALFGLLQPFIGSGVPPTIVALTLYGIYPVLRNTVAGLSAVEPSILEAARGMGMGPLRRMVRVQVPLAWPVIISGIRVAVLILISISVVAALIRGPGLGQVLVTGLSRLGAVNSFYQVLAGTLGCLLVAVVYEIVFVLVQRFTTPRGLRV